MQTVYAVIYSLGDGSNSIAWFRGVTVEQLYQLEREDPDRWSSGDGLQYDIYRFPPDFDFAASGIYFYNEDPEFDDLD
jgi:hypothetical protein